MEKIKIGITGQNGFIGSHLKNTLEFLYDNFELVNFEKNYFRQPNKIEVFVKECDVIVHLAGLNRHVDKKVIYQTNIDLAERLINACKVTNAKPHILFSSSTQEERDNPYGKSKKAAHQLFLKWAQKEKASFTGLIIPNVFGPFGKPNYNSVVATFCHQLTHGEQPKIDVDGDLRLIYVSELVDIIIKQINTPEEHSETFKVSHTSELKVSELLEKLSFFKVNYLENGIIPDLSETLDRNLFNTYLCYIDFEQFFPFHLTKHRDDRGSFVEIVKLHSGGQVSFSTTVPGITRGNHFHTRKAERFAVIQGKARINIRKIDSDKVHSFELDGEEPSFVDMPIWYTHNITNIGDDTLFTLFWINEHYDSKHGDTYFINV
ncbi:MAG: polysaccharide biosynthesis C-terminal domain-containing protein [Aequorivita sp.]